MSDKDSRKSAGASGSGGGARGAPADSPEVAWPASGDQPPAPGSPDSGVDEHGRVKRGKVSAAWVGLIVAALVLVLLIIFIAQNLSETPIHFLGASGEFPIGLSLLIAAIAGIVLAGIPGTVRMVQLRRALRRATGSAKVPSKKERKKRGK